MTGILTADPGVEAALYCFSKDPPLKAAMFELALHLAEGGATSDAICGRLMRELNTRLDLAILDLPQAAKRGPDQYRRKWITKIAMLTTARGGLHALPKIMAEAQEAYLQLNEGVVLLPYTMGGISFAFGGLRAFGPASGRYGQWSKDKKRGIRRDVQELLAKQTPAELAALNEGDDPGWVE